VLEGRLEFTRERVYIRINIHDVDIAYLGFTLSLVNSTEKRKRAYAYG